MNNKFSIILIALCALLPLTFFAVTPHETCSNGSIGQKWVLELVAAYNDGKLDARLSAIDSEVQKGIKEGAFDGIKASINEQKEALNTLEAKKEVEEMTARLEPYRNKSTQLKKESKEALKKVLNDYPASEIARSINAYNELSCCEEGGCSTKYPALQNLENILDSKDISYPQFAEIADKYELRRYAIMGLQIDFEKMEDTIFSFPTETFADQYEIDSFLIRFEEFLGVFKIAQTQTEVDDSFIVLMTRAIDEYIECTGKMHDIKYLRKLGNGNVSPRDDAEKQVAGVMSDYLVKHKALTQEYFSIFKE